MSQVGNPCVRNGPERIFSEKVSGVAAKRPELDRVLDELEAGDVLVVTKLDRLARSTLDLLRIIERSARKALASSRLAIRGPTLQRRMAGLMLTVVDF